VKTEAEKAKTERSQWAINATIAGAIVTVLIPFCFSGTRVLEGDLPGAKIAMYIGFYYLMAAIVIIVMTPFLLSVRHILRSRKA
jgi:uncharacterized membrane protein